MEAGSDEMHRIQCTLGATPGPTDGVSALRKRLHHLRAHIIAAHTVHIAESDQTIKIRA